ncbi:MAG: NAD-dependent protein deacylase [Deltaproteobacteria bacterium]|nr:NAD-dependent protein deacylase [Deltaproteobacteria bacterium]
METADKLAAHIGQAAALLAAARYAVALTGAGISVESGIPPFRGPGGLWTKHGEPPLNGYQRFLADPRQAWEERLRPSGPMGELWQTLQQARPNPGHYALAELEALGVLRCLITQNVDDLHRQAGSRQVAEIHGNYRLVRCLECGVRLPFEEVSLAELPPRCRQCGGIMKSDTVSFGEPIPPDVLERCFDESERADCMLVAGTSATVYPAAQFPLSVRQRHGHLIEINPYESEISSLCTVTLAGPAGEVLSQLVERLKALRAG